MTPERDTEQLIEPVIGRRYIDATGMRSLEVTAVQLGDRLGREVIGLLSGHPRNGHAPQEYATDLTIFASIWRPA